MGILQRLRADKAGIAAMELGLILCLVTLSIFGALYGLRDGIQQNYTTTADKFAEANSPAG